MAQLSDDCFAFGGPMMSVDEAVGLTGDARDAGRGCRDGQASPAPMAAFSRTIFRRRCRCRPSPIPPSTAMRFRAATCRSRKNEALPVIGRVQAGSLAPAPLQPGAGDASLPAHRCPTAPTPCSCRKTSASKANKVVLPAGLKPGANVRPAGEDIPSGFAALKAGQRLRPQDVALAAAFGLTQLDVVRRDSASRCSPPAMNWRRRAKHAPQRSCSIPTASC